MKRTVWMMAAVLAVPSLAQAQSGAVVQPIPPAAAVEMLNRNLARLSKSPEDVDALLGAGQAALDLGDVDAANGFFTRANIINPILGRAKLGLAIVELALKQPDQAAANFDAAERLGEHADGHLADRGLAYDLTGQQARAQRDYQAALRVDPSDDKAKLRYAVSLGISGQLEAADKLLEPALQAGDREAWRMRAFIYAMNNRQTEARSITQNVMPKGLAEALDPYMMRVSLLTPAQKAAAAHFGDFPSNVLRMTPPPPSSATQVAGAARKEPPKKEPPRKERGRKERVEPQVVEARTVVPSPPPVQASAEPALTPPPPPPPQAPGPVLAPPPPSPAETARMASSRNDGSAFGRSLALAMSSLSVPSSERKSSVTPVDLDAVARIQEDRAKREATAKAKAEATAKAKAEAEQEKKLKANPSRIFVQLAAGKNDKALAFSLKRFRKTYASAIGDVQGWSADWGATNRILVGPYRKESSAQLAVERIKKAGGDAFIWESEAGEEVRKIGEK